MTTPEDKMVKRQTWNQFRESKLLWFVNRTIHIFGWAIVFDVDPLDHKIVEDVYPARVKYRGFDDKSETEGFAGLSKYMRNNCHSLVSESEE